MGMLCSNTDPLGFSCPACHIKAGSCQPQLFIQSHCRPYMSDCCCRNGNKRWEIIVTLIFVYRPIKISLFCLLLSQGIGLQFFVFPDFARHLWSYSCRGSMGTQGSGRKRAPLKDRFSAEDEALSSIAREVSSYSITNVFPILNKLPWIMAMCFLHCSLNANMILSSSIFYPHPDNVLSKHR